MNTQRYYNQQEHDNTIMCRCRLHGGPAAAVPAGLPDVGPRPTLQVPALTRLPALPRREHLQRLVSCMSSNLTGNLQTHHTYSSLQHSQEHSQHTGRKKVIPISYNLKAGSRGGSTNSSKVGGGGGGGSGQEFFRGG